MPLTQPEPPGPTLGSFAPVLVLFCASASCAFHCAAVHWRIDRVSRGFEGSQENCPIFAVWFLAVSQLDGRIRKHSHNSLGDVIRNPDIGTRLTYLGQRSRIELASLPRRSTLSSPILEVHTQYYHFSGGVPGFVTMTVGRCMRVFCTQILLAHAVAANKMLFGECGVDALSERK